MATILVVEDERDFRELLGDYLQAMGHRVLSAASVAEAIGLVREDPDIGLIDWTLPDGVAPDVLAALGSRAPSCRIVLMTGHSASVADGLDVEVQILRKPFRLSEVAHMLKSLRG